MNDYERIARVIQYLDDHHTEQPDLETLAKQVGISSSHFHRLFSAWAGVTPKDFLQSLTLSHAKNLLHQGESVLDASLGCGLSGPGRLHDLCVSLEAASPGEIKSGGAGWEIQFGFAGTPFGPWLVAEGPRGVCHVSFVEDRNPVAAVAALQEAWPEARLIRDDGLAANLVAQCFERPTVGEIRLPLRAFVRGTEFQVRVWRALLQIPAGTLVSYGRLAAAVGNPDAARAVGTAVGQNSLAWFIPCHRVIRETGVVGDYRWGKTRKRAMIGWESSARCTAEVLEKI